MPHVVLETDVNPSGVARGMAQVRNHVLSQESAISGSLARMFAVGSVVAFGRALLENAGRIQDYSDRYQVSTKFVQQWANAHADAGGSMEDLGRAVKKLRLEQAEALAGNEQSVATFKRLGISVEELRNLSPEELFERLAHSNKNVADMTALFGKNAQDLIPTMEAVANGTIRLADVIDDPLIKQLDAAGDAITRFQQKATIEGSKMMAGFLAVNKVLREMTSGLDKGVVGVQILGKTAMRNLLNTPLGDFGKTYQSDIDALQKVLEERYPGPRPGDADFIGPVQRGGGGREELIREEAAAGGRGGASRERLRELEREHYLSLLSSEEKLAELQQERADRQEQINYLQTQGYDTTEEVEELSEQILETEKQIGTLQEKITSERVKQTIEMRKLQNAAEDAYEAERDARLAREAEANRQGYSEAISGRGTGIASIGGAAGGRKGRPGFADTNAFGNFTNVALGLSIDPRTGLVDPERYRRESARDELSTRMGQSLSARRLYEANYRLTQFGMMSYQRQTATNAASNASRMMELQGIISGSQVVQELQRQTRILSERLYGPPG